MNSHFFFVNAWCHCSAAAMTSVPFHSFQALESRFSISDLCKVQKEQKWGDITPANPSALWIAGKSPIAGKRTTFFVIPA